MKILITGSFCSGKSTLSSQLHFRLKDSLLIKEVSRELLEVYDNIDWSLPELRDYLIVRQILLEKKASLKSSSNIIVDAGIISNIAHDRLFNLDSHSHKNLICSLDHSRYDLVFYCNYRDISIIDDGKRYTDGDLQKRLDYEIKETLKYLNYMNYISLQGTKNERLNIALKYICEE